MATSSKDRPMLSTSGGGKKPPKRPILKTGGTGGGEGPNRNIQGDGEERSNYAKPKTASSQPNKKPKPDPTGADKNRQPKERQYMAEKKTWDGYGTTPKTATKPSDKKDREVDPQEGKTANPNKPQQNYRDYGPTKETAQPYNPEPRQPAREYDMNPNQFGQRKRQGHFTTGYNEHL